MDKERDSSASETLSESSSCSGSLQNFLEQNERVPEERANESGKLQDSDLVLDLRNVPAYNADSEDDDGYEKLSAVSEQPEDSSVAPASPRTFEDTEDEALRRVLRYRIKSLHDIMSNLKEELRKEVALWRREREEFELLRERNDVLALEEATAAARAAAAAYAAESPLSTDIGQCLDITSDQTLRELTILEYEKKLAKYQDALALAQAEKRYNARRQMIAKAYKHKLLEVEKLCNEELEKIRQNASSLQPLKEMVSQWYADKRSAGDTGQDFHRETGALNSKSGSIGEEQHNVRKIDAETNIVREAFGVHFHCNGISKADNVWIES